VNDEIARQGRLVKDPPAFKTTQKASQTRLAALEAWGHIAGALSMSDHAGDRSLSTKDLNAETFALRVTTVLYATLAFFVSHINKN